ncbi:unnamed protein product [Arctia plantaginis]|uniref:Uncharacterized protein n=1 Tax=Arctia plantaginis TaxID=874455 RepID=A0A8S1B1V5_ARCPL|nr:unnamed protein product [Arctia plantaginis]
MNSNVNERTSSLYTEFTPIVNTGLRTCDDVLLSTLRTYFDFPLTLIEFDSTLSLSHVHLPLTLRVREADRERALPLPASAWMTKEVPEQKLWRRPDKRMLILRELLR